MSRVVQTLEKACLGSPFVRLSRGETLTPSFNCAILRAIGVPVLAFAMFIGYQTSLGHITGPMQVTSEQAGNLWRNTWPNGQKRMILERQEERNEERLASNPMP